MYLRTFCRSLLRIKNFKQDVYSKDILNYPGPTSAISLQVDQYRFAGWLPSTSTGFEKNVAQYRHGKHTADAKWICCYHFLHTSVMHLAPEDTNQNELLESGDKKHHPSVYGHSESDDTRRKLRPRTRNREKAVLLNKDTAKYVTDIFRPYLTGSNLDIHEFPAGLAVLTRALLDGGVSHMTAWEPSDDMFLHLQDVEKSYPGRLCIKNGEYFRHSSQGSQLSYEEWLARWKLEPTVKLVGLFYSHASCKRLFGLLLRSIQHRIFPFHNGRLELLLLVGPQEYAFMTLGKSQFRKKPSFLFVFNRLIWEMETLAKVPVAHFDVKVRKSDKLILKENYVDCVDWNSVYLMRLTPRQNMFEVICPSKQLPGLIFMVIKINKNTGVRLIPLIEEWCPGIGHVLLKMGYSMMDRVKDLEPEDFPRIYKELMAWPSDSYSGLRMEMEKLCHF